MGEDKKPFWNCFTIIVGLATVIATIFAALTYFDIKYPFSKDSSVGNDSVIVEKQGDTKDAIKTGEINDTDDTAKEDTSFVDLGLSVKWASCNLGATQPEEAGNKYAWGETEPKTEFTMENYKWFDENNEIIKYNKKDNKNHLDAKDDPARNYGGRMPTWNEFKELTKKCNWTLTQRKGVKGHEVKGPNGKSIFLPFTERNLYHTWDNYSYRNEADYWSSLMDSTVPDHAFAITISDEHEQTTVYENCTLRYLGASIRPVKDK